MTELIITCLCRCPHLYSAYTVFTVLTFLDVVVLVLFQNRNSVKILKCKEVFLKSLQIY